MIDPDAHRKEMLRLAEKAKSWARGGTDGMSEDARQYLNADDLEVITRLAEHIEALDKHLREGGALPIMWVNDGTVGSCDAD